MKRFFIALAITTILFGAANAAYVIHIPAAAENYAISLPQMIQSFSVLPHTANISVQTFIGTTVQDSFLVLSAKGFSVYSPCDSILIIRPSSTAVTVSPSYNPNIVPILGL